MSLFKFSGIFRLGRSWGKEKCVLVLCVLVCIPFFKWVANYSSFFMLQMRNKFDKCKWQVWNERSSWISWIMMIISSKKSKGKGIQSFADEMEKNGHVEWPCPANKSEIQVDCQRHSIHPDSWSWWPPESCFYLNPINCG